MLFPSVVVPDPESWPDPATAATEPVSQQQQSQTQQQQPQTSLQPTQSAAKKQGKKGKDKWTPLDTEINYTKPKGAVQSASSAQRQPRQSQQSSNQKQQKSQQGQHKQQNGHSNKSTAASTTRSSDNNSGTSTPKAGNAAKKSAQTDDEQTIPKQQQQSQPAVQPEQEQEASQGDGGSRNGSQQGRSQRQSTRGRGRGRGQAQNSSYGRRGGGGHRSAGHAPSHYQGKGNVQTGAHVPVPMPQPVAGDEESVKGYVKAQIEYYFSVDNLCKDIFFRTQMDSDGYVPLRLIAGFNRLKIATTDLDLVRGALDASEKVELSESGDRVRKRGDWATWLFPTPEFVQQQKQQQQRQQQQQQSSNSSSSMKSE
ncbi:hypothetical protein EV175_005633 [Coemansia sp. RSA 1933]|nr:hypothetical protein EV175_005633 [Coemansia sp. RSA 1933]